ncbi:alpha/beta hydrolase family protein [Streptomyces sp. CLI2509]|uniref:alpha/beta hydrolase family protein n=2 Tax=unclassified Streptomyces TaxID=2593676 RepID=UPI000BACE84F|nr:alpha/beta hydrolase [Streptomyces sp. CLI2509]ASY34067.1 alpha/beta hydrolase [Streptomyces sp. CLI2509]
MPDDAVAREAAEADSLFAHPPVPPEATLRYGEHPDQLVDFYAPRGPEHPGGHPLVLVLHGGAWRATYDRAHLTPFAGLLARRGFAVALAEYRRGAGLPGQGAKARPGRWPETFDDIATVLDTLPGLARKALPRADPPRTVLCGHSSGGHLALWAAARHVLPADAPWRRAEPPALRGVVALAPLADLALARERGVCEGAVEPFLGGPATFGERLPYADPARLLPTGIATTLVQGRDDTEVPSAVAESFADAASAAGEPAGVTLLEGIGHYALVDPAADASAVVAEEIAQLAW